MTTNAIDLMKFCDPESRRYALSKPRRVGDFVYATDTRLAIEIKPELWTGELGEEKDGKFPRVRDVIEPSKDVETWNKFPKLPDCAACKNTGEIVSNCFDCNGTGLCICHCCNEHDCGRCGGSGDVTDRCDGCVVVLGNRSVDRKIIRDIVNLPGVVWGVADNRPSSPLFFEFNGGRGAFMPIQPEHAETLKKTKSKP